MANNAEEAWRCRVIGLLLDEHISPALVGRLADLGIYAQSVPRVGLAGRCDREIWQYALDHDFAPIPSLPSL